jgi:hypothetical protein
VSVILWLMVATGPVPEWHAMKSYANQKECKEAADYLSRTLLNTMTCLPVGTTPVPIKPMAKAPPGSLPLEPSK